MSVVTNNMKLSLNKSKVTQKEERWIEQDIIVPDNMPDALKIINVSSYSYINDVEVSNGRVKIVGKMNYSVIYRANDEEMGIRGLNTSCPYTVTIENNKIKDGSDVLVESCIKNIIYSLPNERKIAVKNEVVYNINIIENVNVDVIKDFPKNQEIEYNKCKQLFSNIKENKKGYISSSENAMISKDSPAMYEILKYKFKIKDTEYKESYNKIMLKGIIEIQVLYIGEGKKICTEKVEVPFSGMVETENITDKTNFKIDYFVRDLNVHINPDIEQKTLNVDYKIENRVTLFENEEVEYVEDFYSRNRDLSYEVKNIDVASQNSNISKEINITDSISDIIPENYKIVEYSLDTSTLVPQLLEESINVNGIAKLNLLLQNKENGEIESKNIDIMIDESFAIEDAWKNSNITIKVKDTRLNVIQNGSGVDIKIVIDVIIDIEKILSINSIDKIEEQPLDLKDISSISIYIVKKGDTIWKIAKKYKTSMENIIRINKLENPDMIDIGQKILVIR